MLQDACTLKDSHKVLTIFPDLADERISRALQQRDDVFVERIGILDNPIVDDIVDATGIVFDAKVRRRLEVRHHILRALTLMLLQYVRHEEVSLIQR
jgi:hypothetical protein